MKRPWQVYLIALWIFITFNMHVGMIFGVLAGVISWMVGQYPPDPKNLWLGLAGIILGIGFLVITLAELIWLHSFGIIASIILLLVGCISWIFGLYASSSVILHSAEPISGALLIEVFKDVFALMLNLVCIWYLSHRTFRDYCKKFVEAKRVELWQRYLTQFKGKYPNNRMT